MNKRQINQN